MVDILILYMVVSRFNEKNKKYTNNVTKKQSLINSKIH